MGHPTVFVENEKENYGWATSQRKGTRLRVPRIEHSPLVFVVRWSAVCRREGIEVGRCDQVSANWVLMDVIASGFEVGTVEDEMVSEASLPDGKA